MRTLHEKCKPQTTHLTVRINVYIQCGAIQVRNLKFAQNFSSAASNFMEHHVCLYNDPISQLDLLSDHYLIKMQKYLHSLLLVSHNYEICLTLFVAADRGVFTARGQWMKPGWSKT